MSAFRRFTSSHTHARKVPEGVRSAPYDAPVPLLSTGIPALDDIMCGGGILAGSMLAFVPCASTANESAAMLGAPMLGGDLHATYDDAAYSAAEAYTDLFLGYVTAEGLASHHVNVVIGESAESFVSQLMSQADESEDTSSAGSKSSASSSSTSKDSTHVAGDMQRMKIAWRYGQQPREMQKHSLPSATTSHVFDLSRRISPDTIRQAKAEQQLTTVSLDTGDPFRVAWDAILQAAEHCKIASHTRTPVLRIDLRAFGSPMWMSPSTHSAEAIRFLLRLRSLARTLSMPIPGSTIPPIPTLVSLSLSSHVYTLRKDARQGVNLAHRLMHLMDGCIGLSSFAAMPGLLDIFPDFMGAVRVYKTPSIGTLTNPSLRASILRGMGAGASLESGSNEGGAGGGENNLAFKIKRKRIAIETLHLDTDGGVNERRTTPHPFSTSHSAGMTSAEAETAGAKHSDRSLSSRSTVPASVSASISSSAEGRANERQAASPQVRSQPPSPSPSQPQPQPQPQSQQPATRSGPRLFTGLGDLRQRGLHVAKDASFPSVGRPQDYEF